MNKKIATKSLSALVFALGTSQAAHAAPNVSIQNLQLSEESQISADEFGTLGQDIEAKASWGGSGSYISGGNYSSYVSSGNYASYISAGNYADYISAGNYASYISAGNYARVEPNADGVFPSPQVVAAVVAEEEGL